MLCLLLFGSVRATALKSPGFALRVSLLREVTGAQGRKKREFQYWACGLDSHPFQRMSWNLWILSCSSRFADFSISSKFLLCLSVPGRAILVSTNRISSGKLGEGNVSSIPTSVCIIFVNLRCKLFVESQLHPL